MTIIAIIAVCLAGAFWLLNAKGNTQSSRAKRPMSVQRSSKPHKRYQAASIKFGGCACSAVKTIGEKRFLAEQAPLVPLPECNAETCDCKYIRHEDRRVREDRRAIFCLKTDLHAVSGEAEHRAPGSCRRKTDSITDAASDFDYKDIKWAS